AATPTERQTAFGQCSSQPTLGRGCRRAGSAERPSCDPQSEERLGAETFQFFCKIPSSDGFQAVTPPGPLLSVRSAQTGLGSLGVAFSRGSSLHSLTTTSSPGMSNHPGLRAPMWKLVIEDDEGKRTVVPLSRDDYTIGRQEGNTIRLTERNVSRTHGRVRRNRSGNGAGDVFVLEDLRSYNGVFV